MDYEDLVECLDTGVFSLLIPLGAVLVRRATKQFHRVTQQEDLGVAGCGLTGELVARRLLSACGLDDIAVLSVRGRDVFDWEKREVRLSTANFAGRSLAALATA